MLTSFYLYDMLTLFHIDFVNIICNETSPAVINHNEYTVVGCNAYNSL